MSLGEGKELSKSVAHIQPVQVLAKAGVVAPPLPNESRHFEMRVASTASITLLDHGSGQRASWKFCRSGRVSELAARASMKKEAHKSSTEEPTWIGRP